MKSYLVAGVVAITATASVVLVGQGVAGNQQAALGPVASGELPAQVDSQLAAMTLDAREAGSEQSRQQVGEVLAQREAARLQAEAEAKAKAEAEARAKAEREAAEARAAAAQSQSRSSTSSSTGSSNQAPAAAAPSTSGGGNSNWESTRLCIMRKESGGNYSIVSSNGKWHGAYQFAVGTSNGVAQSMGRPDLVGIPASRWSPADQDRAFWTLWNNGAGRHHWPTARGC